MPGRCTDVFVVVGRIAPQSPCPEVLNSQEAHRLVSVGQHFLLHSRVFGLDMASKAINIRRCAVRVGFSENESHPNWIYSLPCIKSILYEFPHQCGREAVECLCAEELAVNGIGVHFALHHFPKIPLWRLCHLRVCLFMLDPRRGAARAGV